MILSFAIAMSSDRIVALPMLLPDALPPRILCEAESDQKQRFQLPHGNHQQSAIGAHKGHNACDSWWCDDFRGAINGLKDCVRLHIPTERHYGANEGEFGR
mgnify:CR=1 FL=1